jgi:hypothetical protein
MMRGILVAALLAQVAVSPGRQLQLNGCEAVNLPEGDIVVSPSCACATARADAIEKARAAWAPRPPKPDADGMYRTFVITTAGAPCFQECLMYTHTGMLPTDDTTSAACYRCLADAKDARDKAAKEQAERERLAREALDAVDAACGEPKP